MLPNELQNLPRKSNLKGRNLECLISRISGPDRHSLFEEKKRGTKIWLSVKFLQNPWHPLEPDRQVDEAF
jgi:hypothetical protein